MLAPGEAQHPNSQALQYRRHHAQGPHAEGACCMHGELGLHARKQRCVLMDVLLSVLQRQCPAEDGRALCPEVPPDDRVGHEED